MAVIDQEITDRYAIYNADCMEVLADMPEGSAGLSIYSPPFMGLYNYSSDVRDVSNSDTLDDFRIHYGMVIDEISRVMMPGRMSAVHCMDIPASVNSGRSLCDLPGAIIRLHEERGFNYFARYTLWKEPLGVRNRTMAKGLAHKSIVLDSSQVDNALPDYLLLFRRAGENPEPVAHPTGLHHYIGERTVPHGLQGYRGWEGDQKKNRYSHWIWRQYASCVWDDVRWDRVLPYKESKEPDDEKHVHPLQLDVIERTVVMRSNPGDTVLTPFMGVGSEVYGAVINNRRAVGVELKTSFYRQALTNCRAAVEVPVDEPILL